MKIITDENIPFVKKCFSSIGKVEVFSGREMTPSFVSDADVLLVRSVTAVNSNLLAGSKVRFVGTATIGFDHIDVEYLKKNNIGFASAPGSNANSAAEYVIAALLEITHRHNITLEGKSLGIIGVGNVGGKVAKKAASLEVRLYLNDPPLQRQTRDMKYLPLEELYDCDFITLHTPLTFEGIDKTFHLADEKFFKSLKKGSVFINTSRGGVAETNALKAAISSGQLKAAAMDVWEDEPNIDTELLEMVDIGTPHIAGYSLDGKVAGMIMLYKAACEYFGHEEKFDANSFLPEPAVKELNIIANDKDEQNLLRKAVEKIYRISEDDSRMRQILDVPADKRGEFFDNLRKNYPVRREFQNTKIVLDSACRSIAEKFVKLGFKV